MNFKKLAFWTTLFTTAAVPLATAQNPVILQGNYVSNVFGQSNFVLNPNAQTNVANVTVSSATVTRSTTTPLVATSEFNITTSTSTGYADWATRTFDAGMKNQNCEARFTYRGFSVGSTTVQIRQGSNTVAQLTLTASTDPRIASINFPCGDLSSATTLRVQQATAALTGTNELSGLYLGLATNQANVAQAETVVIANVNAQNTIPPATYTNVVYQSESLDTYGEYNNSTGVFTAKRAGNYFVAASIFWLNSVWNASNIYLNVTKNGSLIVENLRQIPSGTTYYIQESSVSISLNVGDTLAVSAYQSDSANRFIASNGSFSRLSISRFPTSSELVVTPERQNVWGAVEYRNSQQTLFAGSAEVTGYSSFNNATWNQPTLLKGKAAVTTTNSGNDLGFSIQNLPVGSYKLQISGYVYAQAGATVDDTTLCTFRIAETDSSGTLRTTVAEQIYQGARPTANTNTANAFLSFQGVYTNTSVATRNFRLEANKTYDSNASNNGSCRAESYASGNNAANIISFTLTPLDQPSNSALYVQGPVLGAQTGATIAAGYVGQITRASASSVNLSSATWTNSTSLALPSPGVYSLSAIGTFDKSTASVSTAQYFVTTLSNTNNADNTAYSYAFQSNSLQNGLSTSWSEYAAIIRPIYVKYDGTNITWPNGSTTSGATVYLNAYLSIFTGTAVFKNAELTAIRLN
jgi:hypothetical protein